MNLQKLLSLLILSVLFDIKVAAQEISIINWNLNNPSKYKEKELYRKNLEYPLNKQKQIPDTIRSFMIELSSKQTDENFLCEDNLNQIWKQYQKERKSANKSINYAELYDLWQQKDHFCAGLLENLSLELFFNFVSTSSAAKYLQQISVKKYAYPQQRGQSNLDWMSGFQNEQGYKELYLTDTGADDIIKFDEPLRVKEDGTLVVKFISKHYQKLTPGSLQQGEYLLKLTFHFKVNNEIISVSTSPFFIKI